MVDEHHARSGFERVLQLTELTVAGTTSPTRRKELLRWRDVVAELYLDPQPDADAHRQAFRCLLAFTPVAFQQRAALLGSSLTREHVQSPGEPG